MPEGDTLHRIARTLGAALVGKTVDRADARRADVARAVAGRRIENVEAIGKNLMIRFDDGRALRTHLRMNGSWHVYRSGERWKKPPSHAVVSFDAQGTVAVCFDAPVVEIVADDRSHVPIAALGPDLVAPTFDESEALRRLRALADVPLGEAVLDQRAVAGIGNIYKSEALFLCGADPFAPVAHVPDEALVAILRRARDLLRRSVIQRTRHRFRVYGRSGRPCFVCGEPIRMRRQALRSTYYCARCQNVAAR